MVTLDTWERASGPLFATRLLTKAMTNSWQTKSSRSAVMKWHDACVCRGLRSIHYIHSRVFNRCQEVSSKIIIYYIPRRFVSYTSNSQANVLSAWIMHATLPGLTPGSALQEFHTRCSVRVCDCRGWDQSGDQNADGCEANGARGSISRSQRPT